MITEFLSFVPLLLVDKLMLDSGAAAMYASVYTAGTDSLAKPAALSAHNSLAKSTALSAHDSLDNLACMQGCLLVS